MIMHYMPQGSQEWHDIRLAKVTSRRAKSVLSAGGEQLKIIDKIIAEEISGQSADKEPYVSSEMQRGIDMEVVARMEYTIATGEVPEQIGFIQSERWPRLGVSPDGLIGDTGAIEIKCPDTATHVRYIREGVVPSEYKHQVLNYFLVHEQLQWLDFVSYDPRFTVQPMFIKRVTRAELAGDIEAATLKLDGFFKLLEETKNRIIFGQPVTA